MALLVGRVFRGFGKAAGNLATVSALICHRTGLSSMASGTLNVRLDRAYDVIAEAEISVAEYHGWERLKLRRCCIRGVRGVIVRPESHDRGNGHGPRCVEIVAEVHLRSTLGLSDGDVVEVTVDSDIPPPCWEPKCPVS